MNTSGPVRWRSYLHSAELERRSRLAICELRSIDSFSRSQVGLHQQLEFQESTRVFRWVGLFIDPCGKSLNDAV